MLKYHTKDFFCLNITPIIFAFIISHMTFFCVNISYSQESLIGARLLIYTASQLSHGLFFSLQSTHSEILQSKSTHLKKNLSKISHCPKSLFSGSMFGIIVVWLVRGLVKRNHIRVYISHVHTSHPDLSPPITYHTWQFFPHWLSSTKWWHPGRTPVKWCQQKRQGRKQDDSQRSSLLTTHKNASVWNYISVRYTRVIN